MSFKAYNPPLYREVTCSLHNNVNYPGIAYATVRDAISGDLLVAASLNYVLGIVKERGYFFVEKKAK
jgi:hypothetical protein